MDFLKCVFDDGEWWHQMVGMQWREEEDIFTNSMNCCWPICKNKNRSHVALHR